MKNKMDNSMLKKLEAHQKNDIFNSKMKAASFVQKEYGFKLSESRQKAINSITKVTEKEKVERDKLLAEVGEIDFTPAPLNSFCLPPPYAGGIRQLESKAKSRYFSWDSSEYKEAGIVKNQVGKLSLACASGVYHQSRYPSGERWDFGFSNSFGGTIFQPVNFPTPLSRQLILLTRAEISIPEFSQRSVYILEPGKEELPYYGITGVSGESNLLVLVNGRIDRVSQDMFMKFKTRSSGENGFYNNSFSLMSAIKLPRGTQSFFVAISSNITSYVSKTFGQPQNQNEREDEYSLVDLRDPEDDQLYPILMSGGTSVKQGIGSVKLKSLCFDLIG